MAFQKVKGYIQKRYRFRNSDSIEVERIHPARYGAPGEKREKRKKPTPEDIERQNQTNRKNRIRRWIKENFFPKEDYWLTFTYKKGKRTKIGEVKKDFKLLIRWIKREYKKQGYICKWIVRYEIGSKGAGHIHLILNRIPDADIILTELWEQIPDSGHIDMQLLRSKGDYDALADYIAKKTEGTQYTAYSRSRNLITPEPRIKEIEKLYMLEEPKPEKGYYIDRDSLVMGKNPVTGHRYQHFTMLPLKERRKKGG